MADERDSGEFGYRQLGSYDVNGWTCVSNALLEEVTVVGPGFIRWKPARRC